MRGTQRTGPEPGTASLDAGLRAKGLTAPRGALPWVLLPGFPLQAGGQAARDPQGSGGLDLPCPHWAPLKPSSRPRLGQGWRGTLSPGTWAWPLAAMTVTTCEPGLAFWERGRLVLSEVEGGPVRPLSPVDGGAVAQSPRPCWTAPRLTVPGRQAPLSERACGGTADAHLHPHRAHSSFCKTHAHVW